MWTVMLVFCPSTDSPLTHLSTFKPSAPHSLSLYIQGLGLGQVGLVHCLCVLCRRESLLLLEKLPHVISTNLICQSVNAASKPNMVSTWVTVCFSVTYILYIYCTCCYMIYVYINILYIPVCNIDSLYQQNKQIKLRLIRCRPCNQNVPG